MKLVIQTSIMQQRRLILEFNKYTQVYAKTFDIRTAPFKQGIRFLNDQDKATLSCAKDEYSNNVAVDIRFENNPSKSFKGKIAAFAGSFFEHLKVAFNDPSLKIHPDSTDVPDFNTVNKWGVWAYDEVKKKFPKI